MWDVIRYPIGNVSNLGWKNVGFDSPSREGVSNVGFDSPSSGGHEKCGIW